MSPVRKIFAESFHDASVYSPGRCAENVARLLHRMKDSGFDLANCHVVLLRGPAGVAGRQQRCPFAEWGTHAFVVYDGMALDLDFKDNPLVLPIADYLKEQFMPVDRSKRGRILECWAARVVPAAVYEMEFGNEGGDGQTHDFHYFGGPVAAQRFRTVRMSELLSELLLL